MAEVLSQENGEPLSFQAPPSNVGSKSPGKSKKLTLGSFFKRSADDRSSSKSERGSSRSKKKISRDTKSGSRDSLDPQNETQTHLTISTEISKNEEQKAAASIKEISQMQFKEFEEELQEPEQKSINDLPAKKVQKRNKELSKQNNQLSKSVDALKKQRVELLSDKQKLKSENKTLERELRKVSSKGDIQRFKKSSVVSVEGVEMSSVEELSERVQQLESILAEKEKKLKKIRDRLSQLNVMLPDISLPASTVSSRRESTVIQPEILQNGGMVDSDMVERLLDERDKNSRLQLENTELKRKMATLESNVEHLQGQMAALNQKEASESSSRARKRSGNLFKRGKAQSKSMVMKSSEDVLKEREASRESESRRSKSPDFISVSDSYQDMSTVNSLSYTESPTTVSLPNFVYSGLSPRTAAKRVHSDILTLQSCLKLAIEEKKLLTDQNKQLEIELVTSREKIIELEKLGERNSEEVKSLKSKLQKADSEKRGLSGKLSASQTSHKKLKSEILTLEKQFAESTANKDSEITSLKEKIKKLQKELTESEKIRKESEDVFVPSNTQTAATTASDVSQTKTVSAKLPPISSTSKPPLPKDAKSASTEAKVRKLSQPKMRRKSSSSSLSSDEHYDSVANTRALFEQKIGSCRGSESQSSGRKTSWTSERRGSYSSASPGLKPVVSHVKSSSFDATQEIVSTNKTNSQKESSMSSASTANKISSVQKQDKQQRSAPVSNTATGKPTSLNISKQSSTSTASTQRQTPTSKETTPVSKVSKIVVKSSASPSGSPILGRQNSKEQKDKTSPPPGILKQSSVTSGSIKNSNQAVPAPSVNVTTKSSFPRTLSVDAKKDVPIKIPTVTNTVVKRTVMSSIRSNTVGQLNVNKVTATTNTPTPTAAVTVTTSSHSTQNVKQPVASTSGKVGRPNGQRPQSMLVVPATVKKASSLQDIPEQVSSESNADSSPPPTSSVTVVKRNPVPMRMQRRGRNERPKTMYAGRAETTNLVDLISRFQQQEATNNDNPKLPSSAGGRGGSLSSTTNGTSSPSPTHSRVRALTVTSPVSPVSTTPASVTLRNSTARAPRPNTYYGAPAKKIVPKQPTSPVSYKKPPPSERKMLRAQTVGGGLGINRQSKKAMLLRWCQRETDAYDNVVIQNFDSSFSDGMAFCALIHHFLPDKIPYNSLSSKNREHNFTLAFKVAEEAGIPSLLDVEDMVDLPIPDWMSVMTYVSFIYNKFGQPNNNS